jgi:hydrogenase maturation factor
MNPGKLPHDLLSRVLARLGAGPADPRVIVGPRVGEDAAVIDYGDRLLVAKTDPITFASDLIGWYAVHVNANDIATMGAAPRWFLACLLLPHGAEESMAQGICDQTAEACRSLGVTVVGGHTEITIGLDRPILVGCMLGEVARDQLVTSAGAQPGDALLLSGGIAIEGTALLAREAPDVLTARGMDRTVVEAARDLLYSPGISVVKAAQTAISAGGVAALHDPTEGGLATGLRELALASGVGMEIWAARIPVLPLTRQVCRALGLAPLGLIASGSLLIAARPERAGNLAAALRTAGIEAAIIGRALGAPDGLWLTDEEGRRSPLPSFDRDELARFLEGL